jgi:hypothetical protein
MDNVNPSGAAATQERITEPVDNNDPPILSPRERAMIRNYRMADEAARCRIRTLLGIKSTD